MSANRSPVFDRYIGIDYSGAQTPTSSLNGLRIYMADRMSTPAEVLPRQSSHKYWTRRGVAEWLVDRLSENRPTLVGIDHGFSFPLRYFEEHTYSTIGLRSSTTSNATGRPTRTTVTWIPSVKVNAGWAVSVWATRRGYV